MFQFHNSLKFIIDWELHKLLSFRFTIGQELFDLLTKIIIISLISYLVYELNLFNIERLIQNFIGTIYNYLYVHRMRIEQ